MYVCIHDLTCTLFCSRGEGEGNVLIDLLKQVSNVATFGMTMTYDGAHCWSLSLTAEFKSHSDELEKKSNNSVRHKKRNC